MNLTRLKQAYNCLFNKNYIDNIKTEEFNRGELFIINKYGDAVPNL